MKIDFWCPFCGGEVVCGHTRIGQQISCPYCDRNVSVPNVKSKAYQNLYSGSLIVLELNILDCLHDIYCHFDSEWGNTYWLYLKNWQFKGLLILLGYLYSLALISSGYCICFSSIYGYKKDKKVLLFILGLLFSLWVFNMAITHIM